MDVIQSGGQWKGEVFADQSILGKASVLRISSKGRLIAQILHRMTAVPAITVHSAHPGEAHPRAKRQRQRSAIDNLAHDLMTWNKLRLNRRQISFNNVQVRAADPASDDPN